MKRRILLIDMDGVIANFMGSLLDKAEERGFGRLKISDIKMFEIKDNFPKHLRKSIKDIISEEGFYLNLDPIGGAVLEVSKILNDRSIDVFFCTSPWSSIYCIPEKQKWIEKYFGKNARKKLIITRDKTLIYGDILIDDKPSVEGMITPNWEHILFDQPYNKDVNKKRIISWDSWRDIIK